MMNERRNIDAICFGLLTPAWGGWMNHQQKIRLCTSLEKFLTCTTDSPGAQDTKSSLTISSSYCCRFQDTRSKTGEKRFTNMNGDLVKNFQVHEEPGDTEALNHLHTFAALSVVFTFVQFLVHISRYIKTRLADELVVYSYFYKHLTRRRQDGKQKVKFESWNHKRMVKEVTYSHNLFHWVLLTICFNYHPSSMACTDIRGALVDYDCFDYDADSSTFNMTCSFTWTDNTTKCIVLQKNEKFEGNGHAVYLDGVSNWEGLFQIATNENDGPSSLDDAPVIHDVHMIGGETSGKGGFIIQAEQKHFIVENCSSSGVIQGQGGDGLWSGGGGICGHECSGDILITHCWSTGEIRGFTAGGIGGGHLGIDGDTDSTVIISHCYSTGDIVGVFSGGMCGHRAGHNNKGMLIIEQCYSLGEIRGPGSGGITGGETAHTSGHVSIINGYSRGDITGSGNTGGICGQNIGGNGGTVILTNVYASGKIDHDNAGGLIGRFADDAFQINITMSVYNGDTGDMIGGSNHAHNTEKNSGDLGDIIGIVYCYNHEDNQCWDTDRVWQAIVDDFPILQNMPIPPPSATPTPTPSISPTPKETQTSTPSSTGSPSNSRTITPSGSISCTPTVTPSASQTGTLTPSLTSSETWTATSSISPTKTATSSHSGTLSRSGTPSPSPTETITNTMTASPSETRTKTPSKTSSRSGTPSSHPTSSVSSTPKETQTATPTSTNTGTSTGTQTSSQTASSSCTATRTASQTGSLTPSITSAETGTVTSSISATSSPSATKTVTSSHSGTLSSSGTPSPSPTETVTSTWTASPSGTRTMTPNETPSPSATPTNKRKREQMELPVQYPPRSVIMKKVYRKKNKKEKA